MNFTNRRFSNPSICEYPSLEVVPSPKKKRSDQNQSMEFNMDLLSLQKTKNEEKSLRKYGVMAHFPKPVKPVLQLPNLESRRFNLSQTKQWRPGEVYNHLRTISRDPGGVEDFLPCTKAHMIRRIYLWPHLPYLESQAFKLQQLYFFQFMDEISTYQAPRKVPKKLSYPVTKVIAFTSWITSGPRIAQADLKNPEETEREISDCIGRAAVRHSLRVRDESAVREEERSDCVYCSSDHCYSVEYASSMPLRNIDAAIKSVAEPEANQLHQSANQRTIKDMYTVKTVYLTNQEELCHETNLHAFYTQQKVKNTWNHLQIYSYQEDMNLTNRRFSNPSICEYLSLEVVSIPKKKRSDPNQHGLQYGSLSFTTSQE
ncbi:hypothetical protein DY000_02058443 [Brassica cretica]|uniref:Uncharacterized protein n=1 Tax=Brassica cretica TaxID=69181 RepID=A0ABQ7AVJ9_BRACR|nr:hypothetical protein DY000_02058443 [Brassica cretica]